MNTTKPKKKIEQNSLNSGGIGGNLALHLAALAIPTIKANNNTFDTIFINLRSGIPRKIILRQNSDIFQQNIFYIIFTTHVRPQQYLSVVLSFLRCQMIVSRP